MSSPLFPRHFVAPDATLNDWSQIEPYFDQLASRDIDDVAALEQWLIDASELLACVHEVGTDRHVKMTCQTDNPERKALFLDFVENIEPHLKKRSHQLNVKYVESAAAKNLPTDHYSVLDRSLRAQVELFREQNIPLQTEEAKLSQQFQEICGAQTVEFDGQEQTLQQLARYAEQTDRSVRQKAWELGTARRLQDVDKLEDIFDQMIQLRHQMAQHADCIDYRAYAFKSKDRFDYTPQDCLSFHDAVERAAVPAYRAIDQRRKDTLAVDTLRPWDLSVDVKGRSPLKPFANTDEFCQKVSLIFHRIDPELGAQFDEMREKGYLDLESRIGKAPGGYQATYDASRHPFIFMNSVGINSDVRTLLHEGGHAFHCYAARHDPLVDYRSSPIEFAEVASFGMEMLTLEHLDEFYSDESLARAKRSQLEGIISLFPWVATIDAFQHFLYTNPTHTREQRREHWLSLRQRFGGLEDYTGYEEVLAFAWQKQLHLFEVPFYYIEYAIAKLGALQVWRNAMQNKETAVKQYRYALSLGGSKPLPDLFQAAGATFDFSYDTLAPLIELVQTEADKLPQ